MTFHYSVLHSFLEYPSATWKNCVIPTRLEKYPLMQLIDIQVYIYSKLELFSLLQSAANPKMSDIYNNVILL